MIDKVGGVYKGEEPGRVSAVEGVEGIPLNGVLVGSALGARKRCHGDKGGTNDKKIALNHIQPITYDFVCISYLQFIFNITHCPNAHLKV